MTRKPLIVAVALTLGACQGGFAGQGYTPVIDIYGSGKDPNMYASDMNLCQQLAASRPQVEDTLRGAGVGALGGAAFGAIAGAIAGSPGAGAGYGAAAGAALGGGTSAYQANQNRQNVVIACMQNRGWVVLGR